MSIPPECLPIASELTQLQEAYLSAVDEAAEARTASAKTAARTRAESLWSQVGAKQRQLDSCRRCPDPPDPATATYEDLGTSLLACSDPRIPLSFGPSIISVHEDPFQRGVSMTFTGCGHDTVLARLGWALIFVAPFPNFTFTLLRRWPDFFTGGFPPSVTTAPYTITVISGGSLAAVSGRYDQATGHLDLSCDLSIGWIPFGAPPRLWWGWYGLNFDRSTFRGLLTTRSVAKVLPPSGPLLTGSPLSSTNRITLVAAGSFAGGFAAGARFELTLRGILAGQPPLGP